MGQASHRGSDGPDLQGPCGRAHSSEMPRTSQSIHTRIRAEAGPRLLGRAGDRPKVTEAWSGMVFAGKAQTCFPPILTRASRISALGAL